jgi:hypothetical protein
MSQCSYSGGDCGLEDIRAATLTTAQCRSSVRDTAHLPHDILLIENQKIRGIHG